MAKLTRLNEGVKMAHATTEIRLDENEYIVKLYIDGKHQQESDYFTDDKYDAIETAKAMRKDAKPEPADELLDTVAELLEALNRICKLYESDPDDLETMDKGIKIALAAINKATA